MIAATIPKKGRSYKPRGVFSRAVGTRKDMVVAAGAALAGLSSRVSGRQLPDRGTLLRSLAGREQRGGRRRAAVAAPPRRRRPQTPACSPRTRRSCAAALM
eukprot:6454687-Pyramimonas_sp.AAC.1